ncbi:MAG TPA: hypothetical protein VJZ76_06040 [Thermoanaerobaculia bacterium]|nr:hypothetical protein [Thermoanaerobaculia bacterium]
MPRSSKGGLAAALLLFALPLVAAQPYHLQLEANPAAPFPFLGKFGTVTIDVYPGGVRAETLLMNGFSRNGAAAITVENPLTRIASNEPLAGIAATLQKLGRVDVDTSAVPSRAPDVAGKVGGITATRHRLVYGPTAWIDVWTTTAIPENPQFRAVAMEIVRGLAPGTAAAMRTIPGTPLYVELNFRRYKNVALLRLKSFVPNNEGEESALKVGRLYFFAP